MHGIRTGLIAAATATAVFAGGAFAASLDSLVIHGDAAKKIHEKYAISSDTAKKMAAACIAFAKQHNVAVSISIMDPIGEMVYFERMDGQGKQGIATAFLKAKTSLNTRQPSRATANAVARGASEFRQWSFGNFAQGGGLPIIVNGNQLVGAIGVGGSPGRPGWNDEICAWRGLSQVMGKQPDLLPVINPPVPAPAGDGRG